MATPTRFEDLLRARIQASTAPRPTLERQECRSPVNEACRICHASRLAYDQEYACRSAALQDFWKLHLSQLTVPAPIRSPHGRHYRTTTKRRAIFGRAGLRLCLLETGIDGVVRPFEPLRCAIEPPKHADLYTFIRDRLQTLRIRRLDGILRNVVIKGGYEEQTVILTVDAIDAGLIRSMNALSKSLTQTFPSVVGVFLYEDSSDGRYYLGSRDPNAAPVFKKLYGKPSIFQRSRGRAFLYHPLAFSQVNSSIVDAMVDAAEGFLAPDETTALYDLYSGYGLFAVNMAAKARSVFGAEISQLGHAAAIENARRNKAANVRFFRCDITPDSLERVMVKAGPNDLVLLDPPRKGAGDGVIEFIASTDPARVLHIFCNIDLIPAELRQWEIEGYRPTWIQPFDAFPGTATVETMIGLERR